MKDQRPTLQQATQIDDRISATHPVREPKDVDCYGIEPGVMLYDRFCALDHADGDNRRWRVSATDITRQLGDAPNHRVTIHFVSQSELDREVFRKLALADQLVQPKALDFVSTSNGLAVVCEEIAGRPFGGNLDDERSIELSRALGTYVKRLHDAGAQGSQVDNADVRLVGNRVRIADFSHISKTGSEESSVASLVRLLDRVESAPLTERLRNQPRTIREFLERFDNAPAEVQPWYTVLPNEAPLVGRREILRDLHLQFAQARLARSSVVVLRGERGIGKTRLLNQFTVDLGRGGNAIVARGVFQRFTPTTRGGIGEALEDLAGQLPALAPLEAQAVQARMRNAAAALTGVLERYSPNLVQWIGNSGAVPEIPLGEDFVRLSNVIARTLGSIGTQRRPFVLVLDNLESADTATLAALRSLGKLRGDHHTLVVASIRGELPAELVGVARVVDVAPLSSTEILEYVDRTLPGPVRHLEQLAGALASDTHGNPLDIWAALNGWLDRGVINRASTSTPWEFSASSPTHPTPIANLYALRAEKLSEDARTIARLLAIRGGEVRSAWIADVLNWEKGTSDLAISELCNAGLVQHRANGTYTFLHDSLRELVIESATKPQRLSTHHAIVRWLDRHPEDTQVGLAAFHREHLTDAGENPELAALHVLAGNEGLTRFDLDASAWHFACAQERSTSIQTTVRSLTGSGDVTAMRNQGETASALYQKAIELAETRAERAEIGSRAVYTLHCRTGNEYSLAVAQHALRALDQPLPQTTIQTIWALLKNIVMIALNVHSRESEDVQDHLAALYTRLSPLLIVRPAMLLVAAMQGVRAAGTRTSGPAATALGFWGVLHCSLGMYKKAERIFDDAESRARQSEHAWSLGVVLHMRGHCLDLPRGSYSAGQQHLDAAVECFEQSGDQSIASLTLMFKTFYGRDRENVTLLGEWLEKAKAIATRHGNQLAEPPLIALGLLLQARLRSASVKSDIAVFLRDLDEREPGVFVGDVVTARTLTAEALQLIGDAEGAYQQARRATQLLGKGPVIEVLLESYAALASSIVKLPVVSASQKRELAIAISKLRASADSAPRMHLAALAATAQQLNLNGSNEYAAVAFERAISEADRNGSALTGANLRVDFAELLTKLDAGRSARELKFARNQFRTLGFPQRTTECSSRGDALPTLESPVITPASRRALNGSLENASERVLVAHTNAWARSTIVQRLNQLGVTSIDEAGTVPPAGYWTMAFVEEALVSDLDRTRAKKLVTLVRRLQNSDADVVLSFPFAANELAKLLVESGITPNEEEPPTE